MRQPEIEAMDRGELELLQLERLQSTLTRAYRQVKFYRRQFDQLGLNLDDIKSLKDLTRLPCTTRDDLSENYPYGLFAVPLRDIVRILSSPGTTEKPLVVGYAPPDLKLWLELLARMYAAAESDPGRHRTDNPPPGVGQLAPGPPGRGRIFGGLGNPAGHPELRQRTHGDAGL